jgi:hypothetical protein
MGRSRLQMMEIGPFDLDTSGKGNGRWPRLNVQINTQDVNLILPETQVPVTTIPDVQVPPDVDVNITTPPPEAPEEELNNAETAITNSG